MSGSGYRLNFPFSVSKTCNTTLLIKSSLNAEQRTGVKRIVKFVERITVSQWIVFLKPILYTREIESFPQQNPKLNRITLMCANAIKAFNVHFIGIIGPISTRADSN